MPVTAALAFSQPGGGGIGAAGFAMIGPTGLAVTVSNGNNTGVTSWTFTLLDAPPTSSLFSAIGIVQGPGPTPTWTFTPDVAGTFSIEITVTDGVTTSSDIRVFSVKEQTGQIMPAYGEITGFDNWGLQAGGNNKRGWATSVETWLRTLDTPITTVTSSFVMTPANGIVEFNGSSGLTATLPLAAQGSATSPFGKVIRRFYWFKNKTNQTNTIARAGSDTIDGATSITLTGTGASAILASDGSSNWDIFGETAVTLNGDVTGPAASTTVVAWRNVALGTSMGSPSNLMIPQYSSSMTSWQATNASSIAVGGVLPGSADQLFDTNHTGSASEWFTVGGDLTYVSHAFTVAKIRGVVISGTPAAGNGLYATASAAASWSALNLAGGSNWVTGTLPVGNLPFGTAGQFLVTNAGGTAAAWATISGDIAASAATVGQLKVNSITPTGGSGTIVPVVASGFEITPSTFAFEDSGGITRVSITLAHGLTIFGNGGSDFFTAIGPYPSSPASFAAAYFLSNGGTPGPVNYSFLGDGTNTRLNALGYVRIESNSSIPIAIFQASSPQQTFYDGSGNAALTFTLNASGTNTVQTDSTATSLVIGTNHASATVVIQAGAAATIATVATTGVTFTDSGSVTRASLELTHGNFTASGGGTDGLAVIGSWTNNRTDGALYLLNNGGTAGNLNYAAISDGTNLYLNAIGAGGFFFFTVGGTTAICEIATTQSTFGGSNSATSPVIVGYSTATTPTITSGTSATTLTVGTTQSSASLILQGDNAATILTLTTLATFSTAVDLQGTHVSSAGDLRAQNNSTILAARNAANSANLSLIATDSSNVINIGESANGGTTNLITTTNLNMKIGSNTLTTLDLNVSSINRWTVHAYHIHPLLQKSTNYTINSSGSGDYDIWVTATATITLPPPESGMQFRVIVAFSLGAGSVTIARHGAENINGTGASFVITGSSNSWTIWHAASNGTDWVVDR